MQAKRNRTVRPVLSIPQLFFYALLFCCTAITAPAQIKTGKPVKAKPVPSWITMMDDPNVNYYEAVAAFEKYWKKRIKPLEEDEMDESRQKTKEEEREERERKRLKADDPSILYAFEYKRFLHWQYEVEPLVQPDGHIKGMDERLKEWETQKELKRQQQQKLKKHLPDSTRKHN